MKRKKIIAEIERRIERYKNMHDNPANELEYKNIALFKNTISQLEWVLEMLKNQKVTDEAN